MFIDKYYLGAYLLCKRGKELKSSRPPDKIKFSFCATCNNSFAFIVNFCSKCGSKAEVRELTEPRDFCPSEIYKEHSLGTFLNYTFSLRLLDDASSKDTSIHDIWIPSPASPVGVVFDSMGSGLQLSPYPGEGGLHYAMELANINPSVQKQELVRLFEQPIQVLLTKYETVAAHFGFLKLSSEILVHAEYLIGNSAAPFLSSRLDPIQLPGLTQAAVPAAAS